MESTKKQELIQLVADFIQQKAQDSGINQIIFSKARGISQSVVSRAYSMYRKEALELLSQQFPGRSFEAPPQKRRLRKGQLSKASLKYQRLGLDLEIQLPKLPELTSALVLDEAKIEVLTSIPVAESKPELEKSESQPKKSRQVFSLSDRLEILVAYLEQAEKNPKLSKSAFARDWGLLPNTLQTWIARFQNQAQQLWQKQKNPPSVPTPVVISTPVPARQLIRPSAVPPKKRIMILGGMHYNLPRWLTTNFEVQQFEQCHNSCHRILNTLTRNPPDALIVIARAVAHCVTLPVMKVAKKYKIPCLSAETGMCSILPEAQRMKLTWLLEAAETRKQAAV